MEIEPRDDVEPFSEEYIDELDGLFTRYGGQWHGKRLDELVRETEEHWDEADYASLLWKVYRFVNHWNNYMLHHSSIGVSDAVAWPDPEESPIFEFGPSRDWVQASLFAAHMCYGLLVLCILRRFSAHRVERFNRQLEVLSARYRTITNEEAKGVGRNDPCPCGSGEKFKRCHEPCVVERDP